MGPRPPGDSPRHAPPPRPAGREKPREAAPCRPVQAGRPHLALMRYWARLMLAGVPVMVIWRSDDPSVALAILICAPDICRISLILVPWRPIMQPISWKKGWRSFLEENPPQPVCIAEPLGKLQEALPWPAHPQHVKGSRGKRHAHPAPAGGREPRVPGLCLASTARSPDKSRHSGYAAASPGPASSVGPRPCWPL